MSRQSIIGVLTGVAIAAFVTWIARNTYWEETTVPAPPRGEAARNPFYAAQRVLDELGATTEWRRTLGEMPEPGAALVLTYWHWSLIESRRVRIEKWVESGGRLVFVGWVTGGRDALDTLEEWSGLKYDFLELPSRGHGDDLEAAGDAGTGDAGSEGAAPAGAEAEDAEDAGADPDTGLPPFVSEPGSTGCRALQITAGGSYTDPSREEYTVCELNSGQLFSAREPEWAVVRAANADGTERRNPLLEAARVPVGRGSVTWINADLFAAFDARNFLDADHAMLFVDALELDRGDHVVFVSEERSAPLLVLIWTYGAPAVVLLLTLLGLALWRNAARFGPLAASPDAARRSLAEQIRGTAEFALRVGGGEGLHGAMVRALHEAARLRIPGYERMDPRERVALIARTADVDADRLAAAMHAGRHSHAHELRTTVALLDEARRQLSKTSREERRQ